MKPLNKIILRVAVENEGKIKFSDGTELFFDPSYNPNWYKQQIGQVAIMPINIDEDRSILKVGDVVYFHHLATEEVHEIEVEGEKLYMQDPNQIFAVKRGDEIICFDHNVFIEQVAEKEENIKTASGIFIKSAPDEMKEEGIVIGLPKSANEWDFLGEDSVKFDQKIAIGSHVKFRPRTEYQINADFGRRKVYKMNLADILYIKAAKFLSVLMLIFSFSFGQTVQEKELFDRLDYFKWKAGYGFYELSVDLSMKAKEMGQTIKEQTNVKNFPTWFESDTAYNNMRTGFVLFNKGVKDDNNIIGGLMDNDTYLDFSRERVRIGIYKENNLCIILFEE